MNAPFIKPRSGALSGLRTCGSNGRYDARSWAVCKSKSLAGRPASESERERVSKACTRSRVSMLSGLRASVSRQRQPSSFRDQLLQRFPECLLHWLVALFPLTAAACSWVLATVGGVGSRRSCPSRPSTVASTGIPAPGSGLQCPCAGPVDRVVQQLTVLRRLGTSGCSMMMIDDGAKQQRKVGSRPGSMSKRAGSSRRCYRSGQTMPLGTAGSSCIRGCSSPLLGSVSHPHHFSPLPRAKNRGDYCTRLVASKPAGKLLRTVPDLLFKLCACARGCGSSETRSLHRFLSRAAAWACCRSRIPDSLSRGCSRSAK